MRKTCLFIAFVALFAGSSAAQGWEHDSSACDRALARPSPSATADALRRLARHDHAAVVAYLFRFLALEDAAAHPRMALRLLRALQNPRSLRATLDRLPDPDLGGIAAEALAGREDLHLLEDLIRAARSKARRRKDSVLEDRYALLLGSRVSVLDDLPDVSAAVSAEAKIIEEALVETDPARLEVVLAGLELTHPLAALAEVHRRLVLRVLQAKPLRALEKVHDLAVRLRFGRAWRADSYFSKQKQKQAWDKTVDTLALLKRAPDVDFGDPAVARDLALVAAIRALLAEAGVEPPGPPWHPDLFSLNRGRRVGPHDIDFTPADRDRRLFREGILGHNRAVPGIANDERENARLVNDYRREYRLLPLRIDPDLVTSARGHSRFQHRVGQMAHEFPRLREPAGFSARDRMIAAGYPPRHAGGENVLFGTVDPREALEWWIGSAGHRANMLSRMWTEIGVGRSGVYWTQNFGTEPYGADHHED